MAPSRQTSGQGGGRADGRQMGANSGRTGHADEGGQAGQRSR